MNRRPLALPEPHRGARILRILGLTLLALVLIAAMTAMGLWQLGVYRESQALDSAEIAQARPVPLDSLLRPDQAFTAEADSRPVVARGEYADRQFLDQSRGALVRGPDGEAAAPRRAPQHARVGSGHPAVHRVDEHAPEALRVDEDGR